MSQIWSKIRVKIISKGLFKRLESIVKVCILKIEPKRSLKQPIKVLKISMFYLITFEIFQFSKAYHSMIGKSLKILQKLTRKSAYLWFPRELFEKIVSLKLFSLFFIRQHPGDFEINARNFVSMVAMVHVVGMGMHAHARWVGQCGHSIGVLKLNSIKPLMI